MKRGDAWEGHLALQHRLYAQRGEAHVVRCHPEARMVQGRLLYTATGPPDYIGFLPGVTVIFDAKSIQSSRFPFAKLPGHQAEHFERSLPYGVKPFLAVRCDDGDFVVPWNHIAHQYKAWANGEKVNASCRPLDYQRGGPYGWLPAVRELIGMGKM